MTRSVGGTRHSMVICLLLLAMLLGLAACGGSTVQCPARPAPSPSLPEEWAQAPGEVALALPTTIFGTDEYVQAAVFNHSNATIEVVVLPHYDCPIFQPERLDKGIWHSVYGCHCGGPEQCGAHSARLNPRAMQADKLQVFLSPGTYRLRLDYAIYPGNPEKIAGTVYSLPFQVCVCARCA